VKDWLPIKIPHCTLYIVMYPGSAACSSVESGIEPRMLGYNSESAKPSLGEIIQSISTYSDPYSSLFKSYSYPYCGLVRVTNQSMQVPFYCSETYDDSIENGASSGLL
jgi:hypothetical protein